MNPISNAILAQYASPAGRSLYRHMMGGDSDHTHYGIYEDPQDPMREAATRSCRRLLGGARALAGEPLSILDLGAGAGGPAQCLLEWTSASVVAVDLGEEPLRALERKAREAGWGERLEVHPLDFENLPEEWTGRFDLVWSQEAICHAQDRSIVFRQAHRVLRPGGVFAFTDILLAESAPADQARVFASVNSGPRMGTAGAYLGELRAAGFGSVRREDWSEQLPKNFQAMKNTLSNRRDLLLGLGVSAETLGQFSESLEHRLLWDVGGVLQWWAHWCTA